jgi:NTP pyrophosphatase (non-canonical NTP hydrolase)
MNLCELQADRRHFAAERDWQPFHTPKNLSTALIVEAAELAEVFQWMTPEESLLAHQDPASKQRIGEEVADVLLYLLQLNDKQRDRHRAGGQGQAGCGAGQITTPLTRHARCRAARQSDHQIGARQR